MAGNKDDQHVVGGGGGFQLKYNFWYPSLEHLYCLILIKYNISYDDCQFWPIYPTHIKWREDVQHNVVDVERCPGDEEDDAGRYQNAVRLLPASQLAGDAGIVDGGDDCY